MEPQSAGRTPATLRRAPGPLARSFVRESAPLWIVALLDLVLIPACEGDPPQPGPDAAVPAPPAVVVDSIEEAGGRGRTLRLRLAGEGHEATVLLHASGLLSLRVDGDPPGAGARSMDARLELLAPLVDSALRIDPRRADRALTVGLYPELAARIAGAALCAEGWDPATGTHASGDPGAAVARLIRQDSLLPELTSFFARRGWTVGIGSAEAVTMCDPADLDAAAMGAICPTRPPAGARLPCGAQLLFRLHATDSDRG